MKSKGAIAMSSLSHSIPRRPLTALGKLALTALIALAALMSYVEVAIFNLALSGFAFIAIPLVLAGVIARGWRWAPLLGAIWCGLMLAMNIQFTVSNLTHPEQFAMFTLEVGLDLAMIGGV